MEYEKVVPYAWMLLGALGLLLSLLQALKHHRRLNSPASSYRSPYGQLYHPGRLRISIEHFHLRSMDGVVTRGSAGWDEFFRNGVPKIFLPGISPKPQPFRSAFERYLHRRAGRKPNAESGTIYRWEQIDNTGRCRVGYALEGVELPHSPTRTSWDVSIEGYLMGLEGTIFMPVQIETSRTIFNKD